MKILNYFNQILMTLLNYFHPHVCSGNGKPQSETGVSVLASPRPPGCRIKGAGLREPSAGGASLCSSEFWLVQRRGSQSHCRMLNLVLTLNGGGGENHHK